VLDCRVVGGVRRQVLTQMGDLPPACKACATDGDNKPAATIDERHGVPRTSSMDTTIDDDFEEDAGGSPELAWRPTKVSPVNMEHNAADPSYVEAMQLWHTQAVVTRQDSTRVQRGSVRGFERFGA